MIGKSTLKRYEFKAVEDYFNYIIESKINGNYLEVRKMIKKLSKEQKKQFFDYVENQDGLYNLDDTDRKFLIDCLI